MTATASAQDYGQTATLKIWDNTTAPHSNGIATPEREPEPNRIADVSQAVLYIFPADPAKATGQAVVICPGGGYVKLCIDYEGYDMAKWFAANGITAAVLKYRMPNGHPEVPLEDVEQALRIMMGLEAGATGFTAGKVGIVGSSAGGHLAASASTLAETKPAFSILFYPVITAEKGKGHQGSFNALLGGSRISMYLTWELARTNTHVRIVEQDHDKCLFLSQHLPGTMVIEGDGTDNDLIQAENIFGADGFVSLTGRDEENLLMAMSARRAGVRKVLAKMTRPNYIELVQDTGLGSIISPKDIIANQITRYVRALANSEGMAVESLYKLLGGQVEALEFLARGASNRLLHVPLKDLQLRSGVLLAAIVRGGVTMIPSGMTTIEEGDHVLVIARSMGLKDLTDILA